MSISRSLGKQTRPRSTHHNRKSMMYTRGGSGKRSSADAQNSRCFGASAPLSGRAAAAPRLSWTGLTSSCPSSSFRLAYTFSTLCDWLFGRGFEVGQFFNHFNWDFIYHLGSTLALFSIPLSSHSGSRCRSSIGPPRSYPLPLFVEYPRFRLQF